MRANNSSRFLCGYCEATYYPTASGACDKCGTTTGLGFVVVLLLIIFAIPGVHLAVNVDPQKTVNTVLFIGMLTGITIGAVQMMTSLLNFRIEWVEPLASLMHGLDIFTFQLQVISPSFSLSDEDEHIDY